SEVKRRSADGSVGSPHARVGHCQASNKPRPHAKSVGFLLWVKVKRKAFCTAEGFFYAVI
ncbi:hypothetical protein, partial [Yersinia massiliensis]|uniref:hypothetical protein n=1 Tax=Yersinia massiliensis TaxID=419257 RepID=UPI001C989D98